MKTDEYGFNFENTYARLPELFFSHVELNPVPHGKLVIFNEMLAKDLGLNGENLRNQNGLGILSGNVIPSGGLPIAQAYGGHQFGHFTKLGDGRAILLGEQLTPNNERYDIQLKGSGRTPYSRGGDGKATLGPMLREYIISEAMHGLQIPTTRSLAVVMTGEKIYRETKLPGAILTRVAKSHLRVGTFQYASVWGSEKELKALVDYAIERHYPRLLEGNKNRYLSFLQAVIDAQARLISQWMLVGFIHGVMNTDNVAISGETIDYGPCAFMDVFNPATVFSSIDEQGRYAYANQPKITAWNLSRFAETLLPLLDADQNVAISLAEEEIKHFSSIYDGYFLNGMRKKLGITTDNPQDKELTRDLLHLMYEHKADYTNTFLDLTFERFEKGDLYSSNEFKLWKKKWKSRQEPNAFEIMEKNNPALIPRNYKVEEVLRAAVQDEDFKPLYDFLKVLKSPYDHSETQRSYARPPDPSVPYVTYCGT